MGEQAQNEAVERIKKEFNGLVISEEQSANNKFDIMGKYQGKEISFEVKWDIMAEKTGNVAIEYESRGKMSGISVTKACYWIYKISGKFYLIKTEKIKEEINNKAYHRNVTGGDYGSNTKMYLITVPKFISWGKEI